MKAYRVNIDGRIYEGQYHGRTNAVYGAMLKDKIAERRAGRYIEEAVLVGVEEIDSRGVRQKIKRVA